MSLIHDLFGLSRGEKGRRKIRVHYVDGEVEKFEIDKFVPLDDLIGVSVAGEEREVAFNTQEIRKIEDYVGGSE